ncbi:uncharacterized protein LOC112083504 [Eutrema salsugineum]|uniref:uncharacterized protein LOC112083504 n=1 Tax=Eutrema salsugineum TaxID=72664 RepID=UPI000CED069F|nr:uncharacterized protein LOC112083504 [Eutrema salsugineum]
MFVKTDYGEYQGHISGTSSQSRRRRTNESFSSRTHTDTEIPESNDYPEFPELDDIPEISAVPESCSHTPPSSDAFYTSINNLLGEPGRELCTPLDPLRRGNATWFGYSNNGISKCILRMLHSLLKKPYKTFSVIPIEEKNIWFKQFAQEFTWHPNRTKTVEGLFLAECATQFSRNMYKWKQNWRKGKGKPKGLNATVWKLYIPYWENPETEKKSKTNSTNKRSDRKGKGQYVHNSGSTSFLSQEDQMTREAGGVHPDHLQLMKKVHTKKGSNVIQDPLMNEIYEKVTQTIESSQQSQGDSSSPVILSREEINRLVREELPLKKGRRRGLGNVVSSQESFGSSSYPEDIVEQNEELKAKAADLEHKLDATQQELTTTKSELTTTRSEVTTMASWMKARFPDFPGFGSSGTENPET